MLLVGRLMGDPFKDGKLNDKRKKENLGGGHADILTRGWHTFPE